MCKEQHSYPSVERPVKIYMCGNDDCSYSATFMTVEEAMSALVDIERNPTFELLKKHGFEFTN